jgi:hypothetical protein
MFQKIEWCILKLRDDYKWWVEKISHDLSPDAESGGIIDPRQFEYMIELMSPLMDYGLHDEIIENAFLKYRIVSELPDNRIKVEHTATKVMTSGEPLFLMPHIVADNDGPYGEFIHSIIRSRMKLLNESNDFKGPIDVEEIEESIREKTREQYAEGNVTHVFDEIVDILEYTPAGYDVAKKGEYEGEEEEEVDELAYVVEDEDVEADEINWNNEELKNLEIIE